MPRKKKDWGPPRKHIQVIDRAASVIRALQDAPFGLRLSRLQERTGLKHGTLHRILHSLTTNGFTQRNPQTGRHHAVVKLA